jgi:WD40 repeat protein
MAGHLGEITSVRLIESAGILLTVNDENVRVFDQNSMNMHVLVGHSDLVLCSAVAPSLVGLPGLVATGAKDQTVRVWAATEAGNWRCVLVLSGHTGPVSGLAFSRGRGNALMLASCSEDRTLKVWKIVDNGSPIWSTTTTTHLLLLLLLPLLHLLLLPRVVV